VSCMVRSGESHQVCPSNPGDSAADMGLLAADALLTLAKTLAIFLLLVDLMHRY
jgi:hypothetical protein